MHSPRKALDMGKLVRDRIPEIIRADGGSPRVSKLKPDEFRQALLQKLLEESEEAVDSAPDHLLEELADVQEVLLALLATNGWTVQDLEEVGQAKRSSRGAFAEALYLHEDKDKERD